MTYPSKTYKVFPLYRILFDCCIDVVREDKSTLLKVLLRKFLGIKKAQTLNRYQYNEFAQEIVEQLEREISKTSYDDVKFKVATNQRMVDIRRRYNRISRTNELTTIHFRVPKETILKIRSLKNTTLGEVVELAIGNYIITCEEHVYELILLTFENYEDV
ncbi:hypothetical protein ABE151_17555 [Bacillus paralicheniformis]|jgi:hypothetical protein|uniref:hypothetical protein n=1 Tax=Bacillus paralicheniformis TaxID=1648923 RepID=UPI003D247AAF